MRKILLISLLIEIILGLVIGGYFLYFQKDTQTTEVEEPKPVRETKKEPEKLSFIIGGDAMLGRAVAWKFGNDVTKAFENLGQGFFANQTLGIINLEGPISDTEFSADPTPDNLVFNFPPQSIDALKFLGVNAVSLANNHSRNQGKAGLETTQNLLKENGISPVGEQLNYGVERFGKERKLSIITINLLEDDADLTQVIKDEKTPGNWVLIFPHWGGEYQEEAHGQLQESIAHSWIDAGADIIIGSHPHVVQDAEIYNGKPIIYSLGNLVFDQTFSIPTQEGLIIKGEIVDKQLTLEIFPTLIVNYQVELKEGEEKDITINKLLATIATEYIKDSKIELNL